jgi:hypothetical protein
MLPDNTKVTDVVVVTSEAAPSGVPPSSGTGVAGVPQAHGTPPSQISHSSGATLRPTSPIGVISLLTALSATLVLQLFHQLNVFFARVHRINAV